jgi:hypothetical protein
VRVFHMPLPNVSNRCPPVLGPFDERDKIVWFVKLRRRCVAQQRIDAVHGPFGPPL